MKLRFAWIAAAGLAGAAWTETLSPVSAALLEMKKLDVWYGEWTSVGEIHATPLGDGGKFTGTVSGRPSLNGNVAEFKVREKGPVGETEALELCWFDPAAKKLSYVYLGNDGYIEQGPFTMTENLCTWEATGVAGGTPFKIRGTEKVSPDKQVLTRKAELSVDGKTWLPYFDSKLFKIAPAPLAGKNGTKGQQTAEMELVALEHAWAKAYVDRDVATMDRLEAAEWICTTADGEIVTKAEDIADVKSGAFQATEFRMEDVKVRVYGDAAVATALQTEVATYKGKDASKVLRCTDTWVRRDGRWQCVNTHVSYAKKG